MNNNKNRSNESLCSIDSRSRSFDSRCRSISGGGVGSIGSIETVDLSKESSKYKDNKYTKEFIIVDAVKKKRIRDIYIEDNIAKSPNPNSSYLTSLNITEVWLQPEDISKINKNTKK